MSKSRKYFLFLIMFMLIFISEAFNQSKEVGGTIYFEDGTKMQFFNIKQIWMRLLGYEKSPNYQYGKIWVKFENSLREIPFSSIKSIEILNWEHLPSIRLYGTVKIETVTGFTLTLKYQLSHTVVKILDKLTGEIKEQTLYFLDKATKKINIRAIVFNN